MIPESGQHHDVVEPPVCEVEFSRNSEDVLGTMTTLQFLGPWPTNASKRNGRATARRQERQKRTVRAGDATSRRDDHSSEVRELLAQTHQWRAGEGYPGRPPVR